MKKFPAELVAFWKTPGALRAFVSQPEGTYANKCENCGGAGYFIGSIAVAGPFDQPSTTSNVYRWHDGKWWVVKTKTVDCPVCHNGKQEALTGKYVKPVYVAKEFTGLAAKMEKEYSDV
jgi:hypothetical protein